LSSKNITMKIRNKVCQAFEEIHKLGVLHGDIASRNIMIAENDQVFVVDFGLSKMENVSEREKEEEMMDLNLLLDELEIDE
jgi:tRNA A-37 threonylcarbamoyl transferase component Bud32